MGYVSKINPFFTKLNFGQIFITAAESKLEHALTVQSQTPVKKEVLPQEIPPQPHRTGIIQKQKLRSREDGSVVVLAMKD